MRPVAFAVVLKCTVTLSGLEAISASRLTASPVVGLSQTLAMQRTGHKSENPVMGQASRGFLFQVRNFKTLATLTVAFRSI